MLSTADFNRFTFSKGTPHERITAAQTVLGAERFNVFTCLPFAYCGLTKRGRRKKNVYTIASLVI